MIAGTPTLYIAAAEALIPVFFCGRSCASVAVQEYARSQHCQSPPACQFVGGLLLESGTLPRFAIVTSLNASAELLLLIVSPEICAP